MPVSPSQTCTTPDPCHRRPEHITHHTMISLHSWTYQHFRKIPIIFIGLPDRGASLAEVPKPCLRVQLVYEGAESTADCPETGESVIGQVILSSNSCGQSHIYKVLEVTHICRTHRFQLTQSSEGRRLIWHSTRDA